MAPSPKISFSRIIRENYVFRTHSKKFLIWWKRAALNWCVGWKLCLGARGSLHCLLEEKNRKRTIEVLLLLLYFEPKLPNLSIPAVSQNSGPGIFRKSNQEGVLCFWRGCAVWTIASLLHPHQMPCVDMLYTEEDLSFTFSIWTKNEAAFTRNWFFFWKRRLTIFFCCVEPSTLDVFHLNILSSLSQTETMVWPLPLNIA